MKVISEPSSDIENKKKHRNRIIVISVLIMLFTVGMMENEGDYLGGDQTSVKQYLLVYSAFLPLLVYIIPFAVFMHEAVKKYDLAKIELLIAVLCGAFIPCAFAGWFNDGFEALMKGLMGSAYSSDWLGSLETGIVEEALKLGATGMLVYVFGYRSMRSYLATGMCVGMGFQIEEDIGYITQSGFKDVNTAFPTALDRVADGCFGSHWAYAAVTAAGLYLIVRAAEEHHVRKGIGLIVMVMMDHFIFDTPLGVSALCNMILTLALVLPVIVYWNKGDMEQETGLNS